MIYILVVRFFYILARWLHLQITMVASSENDGFGFQQDGLIFQHDGNAFSVIIRKVFQITIILDISI